MKVKMTNLELFKCGSKLREAFQNEKVYFPVKFNYYFLKNIARIEEVCEKIEQARCAIIEHYALVKNNQYQFRNQEDMDKANGEIEVLFSLEQEIEIDKVNVKVIEEITLSLEQMEAIMFMISD